MPETSESLAFCHACGTAMDVSSVAPFANVECPACGKHTRVKREFGPYTLVRRHAVGGMSMVFAGQDNTLNREVAVKILSEEFSANERRITAFEEEARITASFNHPNVVRVLRTGRAFGRFYIAMEFVPGGHFEHQIRERGKIPETEVLPLAIEVAQGLQAAHAAGLIHRDVKPGNILLDATGHAKLVDFGLALVTQGGKAQATELWATPYYVPPETVEGRAEDFRSDIYAFGATFYHALCGHPSCGEESMATDLLLEAKKRVIPLGLRDPSISQATSRVIERAMVYQPEGRFKSYGEMIAALNQALRQLKTGHAGSARAVARSQRKPAKAMWLAGGIGAVALAAAATWALLPGPKEQAPQGGLGPPKDVPRGTHVTPEDHSAEIMKNFREAREAIAGKDYTKASSELLRLHQTKEVQEPTRSWAGIEAVLADFLDGRSADAHRQARATMEHLRQLPADAPRVGRELQAVLERIDQFPPLKGPALDASHASAAAVIATMLAGLKNWEQGLLDAAADCFTATVNAKLKPDDDWAAVYQSLAADYLADYEILSGPLFTRRPDDQAGCEAAIQQLERASPALRTRGRARFNLRAWQLDLTRQAKLAEQAATPP